MSKLYNDDGYGVEKYNLNFCRKKFLSLNEQKYLPISFQCREILSDQQSRYCPEIVRTFLDLFLMRQGSFFGAPNPFD